MREVVKDADGVHVVYADPPLEDGPSNGQVVMGLIILAAVIAVTWFAIGFLLGAWLT